MRRWAASAKKTFCVLQNATIPCSALGAYVTVERTAEKKANAQVQEERFQRLIERKEVCSSKIVL